MSHSEEIRILVVIEMENQMYVGVFFQMGLSRDDFLNDDFQPKGSSNWIKIWRSLGICEDDLSSD